MADIPYMYIIKIEGDKKMKKFLTFALMLLMLFNLASCKKDDKDDNKGNEEVQRTYVVDGQYTAYSINKEATKPEVTLVTVTIKDDKISAVNIDTIQGSVTADGAAFNAQSKKELGYGYHMHWYSYQPAEGEEKTEEGYAAWLKANNKLEWVDQAKLIVEAWVANSSVEYANIAGVTVANHDYLAVLNQLKK